MKKNEKEAKQRIVLKQFILKSVFCEGRVVRKIFDRIVYDGRNEEKSNLEKRLLLKYITVQESQTSKQIVVDHLWLVEDSFLNKEDFEKIIMAIRKKGCFLNLKFTATVNMYKKNVSYNKNKKRMYSNDDYGLRNIKIEEIIENEENEKKINKENEPVRISNIKNYLVKRDGTTFLDGKMISCIKKKNDAGESNLDYKDLVVLIDISNNINQIIDSEYDNGIKECELNKLQHKIKKIEKRLPFYSKDISEICHVKNKIAEEIQKLHSI